MDIVQGGQDAAQHTPGIFCCQRARLQHLGANMSGDV
jgi:hypothetical protein